MGIPIHMLFYLLYKVDRGYLLLGASCHNGSIEKIIY